MGLYHTMYIMPLVDDSLGGGHTHTRILTFVDKEILRNQAHASCMRLV